MNIIAEIGFWCSSAAVAHTYILYPIYINSKGRSILNNSNCYSADNLPQISIVIPAHNEEKVIAQKLESIIKSNYPKDKIEIWIGSDNSTDNTNIILKEYAEKYNYIQFKVFQNRKGKPSILNEIVPLCKNDIIVFTDADILFTDNTLFHLVKHFKNNEIGLVDSRIENSNKEGNISKQEGTYLSQEFKIKHNEGKLWGKLLGPFGGCYAIRKKLFTPIPTSHLVDDFFECINVLLNDYKAISDKEALVYENISHSLNEEFQRKIRIGTGNFQNLNHFGTKLINFSQLGRIFISHKLLRWFTPIFMCLAAVFNYQLFHHGTIYQLTMAAQVVFYLSPFINSMFKFMNLKNVITQTITHFIIMNLALMIGFFRSFKRSTGIWNPTPRN